MKIGKKWIKAWKPHDPITKVAVHALDNRLRAVLHYLPLAAKQPDEDIEYVHQLRVATRRAGAALQVFGDMASKRRAAEMKKTLRHARRAAGAARDLDVLVMRLKADENCPRTVRFVAKLRKKAQKPLRRAHQKLKRSGFKSQTRKLVRSIRWRTDQAEPNYVDFARAALQPSVAKFFAAASKDLSNTESLHAMRIAGKRLRYDMELYAAAFDPSFRAELYVVFKEVQDKLGAINDHATAAVLFEQWRESVHDAALEAELDALVEREGLQIKDSVAEFCKWWTPARADELRQNFQRFIAPQESNGEAARSTLEPAVETARRIGEQLRAVKSSN